MAKKNLVGIAKSGTATAKKPAARKTAAKKTARKPAAKKPAPEPVLSAEELRDKKAKETVNELLQDVDLSLEKKDDLLELDETPEAGDVQSVDWLQEQVGLQAQTIEGLRKELADAKVANPAPATSDTDKKVVELFNELQENYGRLGPNFEVRFPAFLNRMIKFFPFLAEHKRYK